MNRTDNQSGSTVMLKGHTHTIHIHAVNMLGAKLLPRCLNPKHKPVSQWRCV